MQLFFVIFAFQCTKWICQSKHQC